MGILLTLRAKGARGLGARTGMIADRFGPTPSRMDGRLARYVDIAQEFGVRPTLPITASVLARHPKLIRGYVDRNVEFAIHGLVHEDHAALDLRTQRERMAKAGGIFASAGIPFAGFRGPYLRYNGATNEAARDLGLIYHSSQAVAFGVLPKDLSGAQVAAYRRALELYGAPDAEQVVVRPRDEGGLVMIPVAIPDDEIMVDRLGLDQEAQAKAWLAILRRTHERGQLFTMQFHPERIPHTGEVLEVVLREAQRLRPQVWIAALDELATWWLRRRRAVLAVEQVGDERYWVRLEGEPEATLLVRGLSPGGATPWCGRDLIAQAPAFEVGGAVKPVVGVPPSATRALLDFLREEGFAVEVSEDRERFGAYIELPSDGRFDEIAVLAEIESAPGPLVRLWRWPNGARCALAVTGDIDALTLQDFALRFWEVRRRD